MKSLFVGIFSAALGFVFLFSNAQSIKAQETGNSEFTLEEITVTAQKREEDQQKVAIAMDVISGDDLKELGRSDINEILQNISSVLVNKDSDGLRISIRGISDDKPEQYAMATSTPTVALNTDGVFSNRKSSGLDLFDVERVEVLFGPQSTLYASTSFGGVINVVTGGPKTDKYEASGTIEYGNYNHLRTEGMMNAPLSDSMALRAAFTTSVHDGYMSNGGDDEDVKSARLKALYQPNEKLAFMVTGEIEKTAGTGSTSAVAFIDQDEVDYDPWTASSENSGAQRSQDNKKIYANIDWDLGFGALSIIPSYTKRSAYSVNTAENMMGTLITTEMNDSGYEKGVETRLSSNEDFFFKWIFGLNWYDSDYEMAATADDGGWQTNYNRQTIKAAYGNITYPATDQLRITGGMRYSHDVNDSVYKSSDEGRSLEEAYVKYSDPDFKVGLEYDMGENSMIFADWSTSYRTQKGEDADGNPIPPEYLDAYTLGSKSRFFGNKLQINASAYYYKYKNYYVTGSGFGQSYDLKELDGVAGYTGTDIYDPETGEYRDEAVMVMDDNNERKVGDLEVLGFDLQTNAIITEKDKLDLSVSYSHSEWTKLFFDYGDFFNDLGIEDMDYKGKGKVFDPKWTINAAYSHNFNLPNSGIITARLDVRFQSKYLMKWNDTTVAYTSDGYYSPYIVDLTGYTIQEAHYITNFTSIYVNPDGKWSLSGYVKNIENYAVKVSYAGDMNGGNTVYLGEPRTYGAVLTVKY